MFQIHPPSYPPAFTPLAPRDPNTCSYISPSMSSAKPPPRHAATPPSRRPIQNPLLNLKPATEQQQQRRRQAYLGKVRQAREDRKWEGRSELILRAEFLERKRAWEEERAREAAEALPAPDDEEEEGAGDGYMEEIEMVDRILWQEEEECEALVESMLDQKRGGEGEMEGCGSEEDEEWDRLFREVVDSQEVGVKEMGEGGTVDKRGDGNGDGGMDMS